METPDLSLTAHVVKLATLREEVAQRSERIKAARAAFDATIADDVAALEALKRSAEAEDAACRGFALVIHEQTGNTKPAPGVEIKVSKEYDIDETAAFAWAKMTGMALIPESLDRKAIQKIATVQSLHFVTVREVPKAQLATDLTKALDAAKVALSEAA